MDAGLAAVCGALVGASGAVGAAWATSRAQWKGVRLAAKAEHLRQRRESRTLNYRALISVATDLIDRINRQPLVPGWTLLRITDEYADESYELVKILRMTLVDVLLAGPKEVSESAQKLMDGAHLTVSSVAALNGLRFLHLQEGVVTEEEVAPCFAELRRGKSEMATALAKFSVLARDALDNDGTS
ncbi:hypothetical protein AB0L80_31575 [Streptomyces sp. NPDC052069]|uniref:hypothetical protein n=1 Tax=Streptomyces sp. NPDC052069 TaxID=3154650 RepID=UPI00341A709D